MAANTTYWVFHTVDIYSTVAEVREADNSERFTADARVSEAGHEQA